MITINEKTPLSEIRQKLKLTSIKKNGWNRYYITGKVDKYNIDCFLKSGIFSHRKKSQLHKKQLIIAIQNLFTR